MMKATIKENSVIIFVIVIIKASSQTFYYLFKN